ncbi:hypothetical protein chiPu_0009736 [Chiloscyllium punctatum]|uniref:Uncharacterized protein n=1 Tax=Chiloscyllium punctatum TaxID=137246 RepID=A0A401SLM0_CHIPU|nr:hypothetical protein [Chiloscyllium punctatum]
MLNAAGRTRHPNQKRTRNMSSRVGLSTISARRRVTVQDTCVIRQAGRRHSTQGACPARQAGLLQSTWEVWLQC